MGLGLSKLKTRDLEWYFFSVLDKKYGNGARTNRATEKGYWKTTGKDRAVYHRGQIVGMKKTLVYHIGRAPKGQRTNWVMHEYRLTDLELEKAGIHQVGSHILYDIKTFTNRVCMINVNEKIKISKRVGVGLDEKNLICSAVHPIHVLFHRFIIHFPSTMLNTGPRTYPCMYVQIRGR